VILSIGIGCFLEIIWRNSIAEKDKFKIAVIESKSLNPEAKNMSVVSMSAEMFTTEVANSNSFKIVKRE